jgi:hypothetical protein
VNRRGVGAKFLLREVAALQKKAMYNNVWRGGRKSVSLLYGMGPAVQPVAT